jgi:hypothetical protein
MHTQSYSSCPDNLLFSASSPTTSKACAPLQSTSHMSLSPTQSHSSWQYPPSITLKDPSLDHTRLPSFFDQSQGFKSRSHMISFFDITLTLRNITNSEHTYFSRLDLSHLNPFLRIGGVSPLPHTHTGSPQGGGTVAEARYCSCLSISGGGLVQ